jgi:hypothetical protein
MGEAQRSLPRFFRVRQQFASCEIEDIPAAVSAALRNAQLGSLIRPDQSVAIATGSRGISNIDTVIREVVDFVQAIGARPFIVPAMGSHGGATAEGQAKVLAALGITTEAMGCPIRSSMETVLVGKSPQGIPIHFDRLASRADHVIVVNRIKPHTRLVGDFESGLAKMLMIGLGKHRGAQTYHQAFADYDYHLDRIARVVVPMITQQMPITMGVAIVEDAFDRVARIEAVRPDCLLDDEPGLLKEARELMPRLPFDRAVLLVIDQIGKEISGTGMDTNVIGRKSNDRAAGECEFPKIREIFVRSLTSKTNGNATGIGIAEYCHARVVRDIDFEMTRINCVTSGHVSAGAVPIHFDSDRETLSAVLSQASNPADAKWMWIQDTLHLETVACSEAYLAEARQREDLQVLEPPMELAFDAEGSLKPFDSDPPL